MSVPVLPWRRSKTPLNCQCDLRFNGNHGISLREHAEPVSQSLVLQLSYQKEMARLQGEDLNALFDTLTDWDDQLKDAKDLYEPPENNGPQP